MVRLFIPEYTKTRAESQKWTFSDIRNRRLSIRLTEGEYKEIDDKAKETGLAKTDLVLKGIRLLGTEK